MKRFTFKVLFPLTLTASIILGCASASLSPTAPVSWQTSESQSRLARSWSGDFFALVNFYEPQANKLFCGPATGAILLNALYLNEANAAKPMDGTAYAWKENYLGDKFNPVFSKFTQNTFLNEKTDVIKSREVFFGKPIKENQRDPGLTLEQFAKMLETYGLKTKIHHVEDVASFQTQKSVILDSLKDQDSFIVVNFDRKPLGQNGGGHISPLAAYDPKTDSFLVLDVNPVVTSWFWVSSSALFSAMNTKDNGVFRGFVRVSR